MTGPVDPDATRPLDGGDPTLPAGPRPGGLPPERAVVSGPPAAGGPPSGPIDEDDEGRRNWWWIAAGALALGIAVVVVVALLASGGSDKQADGTTTTSSSTTTTAPPVTTTAAPVTPTAAPQPPGQVTDLTAGAGGGSGEVSLHWDAVSGAAQYRVYRSATQGITGSLVATVNSNDYVDVPGTHAYYQVSAVGSGGLEGERSVEVCGAPVGDSC